jgi:hypothetical protein
MYPDINGSRNPESLDEKINFGVVAHFRWVDVQRNEVIAMTKILRHLTLVFVAAGFLVSGCVSK